MRRYIRWLEGPFKELQLGSWTVAGGCRGRRSGRATSWRGRFSKHCMMRSREWSSTGHSQAPTLGESGVRSLDIQRPGLGPASSVWKNTKTSSKTLGPCAQPRKALSSGTSGPAHTPSRGAPEVAVPVQPGGCRQVGALVWFHGASGGTQLVQALKVPVTSGDHGLGAGKWNGGQWRGRWPGLGEGRRGPWCPCAVAPQLCQGRHDVCWN